MAGSRNSHQQALRPPPTSDWFSARGLRVIITVLFNNSVNTLFGFATLENGLIERPSLPDPIWLARTYSLPMPASIRRLLHQFAVIDAS